MEIVGELFGRNIVEKNSWRDTACKVHLNVALGNAGVISGEKLFTDWDTTRKDEEIPKGLLELELLK